jgi:DNA repair protein RadD
MSLIPRDYQDACHWATWNYVHSNPGKNPLVVEPTGTGKSFQIAMFIWHMLSQYPHVRMMVTAHVKELVDANFSELLGVWPAAPVGVYSAGLGERDHHQQITFAGIQSVAKKAALFGHVDFLLVDEAHTISDKDSATYNKFIAALKERNPNLVVIGYTATDYRMKTGRLTEGDLFDDVCFDLSSGDAFLWLIDQGYLSRPVPRNPGVELDSDAIRLMAGEFDSKQTSAAMHDQNIYEKAVDEIIRLGTTQGRKAWLHFATSIDDCELLAEMFTHKGYPHEAVHSKRNDRDEVIRAFKRGELRGVVNKDILTTGFNHKPIDLIGMLRLTRSVGLWVQMLGRGTRPVYAPGHDITTTGGRLEAIAASDKQNCLVLDFVGNTKRLGPINYPRVPERRRKGAANSMITRECPECGTHNHISVKVCQGQHDDRTPCDYEFPTPEQLLMQAGTDKLVSETNPDGPLIIIPKQPKPPKVHEIWPVHQMTLSHHTGKGDKPDSLRVDYRCGMDRARTWVCLLHDRKSYPFRKALDWWIAHAPGGTPMPETIEDALGMADVLAKPQWIKVDMENKFVDGYDFKGTQFQMPTDLTNPQDSLPIVPLPPDPLEDLMKAQQPHTLDPDMENFA